MIELLLSIILFVLLVGAYYLRKLPGYLSEYRDVQVMIWKKLLVITNHYRVMETLASKTHDKKENDRQKIFEINNKLSEIIKLNEKLLNVYSMARPQKWMREISELLESINSK